MNCTVLFVINNYIKKTILPQRQIYTIQTLYKQKRAEDFHL